MATMAASTLIQQSGMAKAKGLPPTSRWAWAIGMVEAMLSLQWLLQVAAQSHPKALQLMPCAAKLTMPLPMSVLSWTHKAKTRSQPQPLHSHSVVHLQFHIPRQCRCQGVHQHLAMAVHPCQDQNLVASMSTCQEAPSLGTATQVISLWCAGCMLASVGSTNLLGPMPAALHKGDL